MSATTAPIATECRNGILIPLALKAGAVVLEGTLAVVDNTGYGISSSAVGGANQLCLGVYEESADNTGGGHADVVVRVKRREQFLFANLSADLITQSDMGANVYVADNQTVAKTNGNGNRSIAGRFMGFDLENPAFVWVEI